MEILTNTALTVVPALVLILFVVYFDWGELSYRTRRFRWIWFRWKLWRTVLSNWFKCCPRCTKPMASYQLCRACREDTEDK